MKKGIILAGLIVLVGAKPLPVLPAAVSCQNSGGTWLIGNEDNTTPEFEERFRMIYDSLKANHPEITVIVTVGPFHSWEDFEKGWDLAKDLSLPVVDEHYYTDPKWFISNQHRYNTFVRNSSKVYLGEYASWCNKMQNAIAEAAYMTSLEHNGDVVMIASFAPLLAKTGFTQWKTDMIFFVNVRICLNPNYHGQKLFSTNQGDVYFNNVISKNEKDTTLAASCVTDCKTGDIILKMVNTENNSCIFHINLAGFKILPDAEMTLFTGNADDENTFETPNRVVPLLSSFKVSSKFEYSAPAMSLTVIRIKSLIDVFHN